MIPRLKVLYEKEITGKLMTKLSAKNKHEVPKIEKVIINMGLGKMHLMEKNLSLARMIWL